MLRDYYNTVVFLW